MKKGYLQVYTGDGKGKTTAAIGLAIRACGAGLKVLFAQFVKGKEYNEIKSLRKFGDCITIKQFGRECFIVRAAEPEDIKIAQQGLKEVEIALETKEYDLVILDEANIALYYKLFSVEQLLSVIAKRGETCEVVVTGRAAPAELIHAADLVTEMREIKHYYNAGVEARDGIEK